MGHLVKGSVPLHGDKRNDVMSAAWSVPTCYLRDGMVPNTIDFIVDADEEEMLKERVQAANVPDVAAPPAVGGNSL